MFRVLAIISLVCIFMPLAVSKYINNTEDPETSTSKNDDIVFRIVNGKPASLGAIPYQIIFPARESFAPCLWQFGIFKVSLKTPVGKGIYMSFCGGSVMAENKVLTAAHCLTDDGNFCDKLCKKYKIKSLMKLYVVAGTLRNLARYQSDEQGIEQWRKMTHVNVPRRYWFPNNDVCIAFTDVPFLFNDYVKPLPLASRKRDYGSMDCVASGWGKINNEYYSDILLWAYLRLIPSSRCSRIHKSSMNKFICTESDVTEILEGDSGGPLVCRNTQDPNDRGQGVIVGVACGYAIRSNRRDSFFTRVTSYLGFLSDEATITPPVFCIILLSQIISNF